MDEKDMTDIADHLYKKVVGITTKGEIVVLVSTFKIKKGLRGALGYVMEQTAKAMVDEANRRGNLLREWKNAVVYEDVEIGFEDWLEDQKRMMNDSGRLYLYDDPNFRDEVKEVIATLPKSQQQQIDKAKKHDFMDWSLVEIGRVFDKQGNVKHPYAVVLDESLIDVIKKAEQNQE